MVLENVGVIDGTVLVVYGDTPLLRGSTLAGLLGRSTRPTGNAVTVLTAHVLDPTGYGRIVRGADGAVLAIVEHKDATPEQLAIDEMNSGVYAFDGALLADAVKRVSTGQLPGRGIPDRRAVDPPRGGHRVGAHVAADHVEVEGVNNKAQLAFVRRVLNDRIVHEHMINGVTIIDPASTWIDADVGLEADAVVPSRHPAPRRFRGGRGRGDRPGLHAHRHRRRRGRRGPQRRVRLGRDRRGRLGGPVRLPAPGHPPGREGQDRHLTSRPRTPSSAPAPRCPI